jgi:hypothetical protein
MISVLIVDVLYANIFLQITYNYYSFLPLSKDIL